MHRYRRGVAILIHLGAAALAYGQANYSALQIIAPAGWRFRPSDLNNDGLVIGTATPLNGGASRAAVWSTGSFTFLPGLGGSAEGKSINNAGQAVGRSWMPGGAVHAVLWEPDGGIRDLGVVYGMASAALGISQSGLVAGETYTPANTERESAFLYTLDTGMQSIGDGGARAWGEAVSDDAVVVGTRVRREWYAYTAPPDYRAWIWDRRAGMRDVPMDALWRSYAHAINNAGRVVGSAGIGGTDPYVWDPAFGLLILSPAKGEARDVNDCGVVVGGSGGPVQGPFIWDQDHGLRELNDRLATPLVGTYPGAFAINDRGQILATAGHWTPNPSSATYWLLNPCYPDCNDDGALTLTDFTCFQARFALRDPYADCDGDGALAIADFGCYQSKFVLGCP